MTCDFPLPPLPLCIVGNVNRDVQVQGVSGTPRLLADGETSVARIVETVGGGGANSACAAAALGARVRFVGKVGVDALAERLRHALQRQGVETYLAASDRTATGTTVALGLTTGHRHFLSCLPNNESMTFDDVDLNALDGCAHLLRADVWFSPAMLEGGNERLFAEARRRNLTVSLDINYDPCWNMESADTIAHRKTLLRSVLPLVDIAHGNIRELCEFTDSADLDTALARLTQWGVKRVVVHMGARGAGYYADGELTVESPVPAVNPVHSTGTGDVLSVSMILLDTRHEFTASDKLRLANRVVREFMEGRRELIATL